MQYWIFNKLGLSHIKHARFSFYTVYAHNNRKFYCSMEQPLLVILKIQCKQQYNGNRNLNFRVFSFFVCLFVCLFAYFRVFLFLFFEWSVILLKFSSSRHWMAVWKEIAREWQILQWDQLHFMVYWYSWNFFGIHHCEMADIQHIVLFISTPIFFTENPCSLVTLK